MSVLITGGCGFIGANAARAFLASGRPVTLLDDFSRAGARRNLDWIAEVGSAEVAEADIREAGAVAAAVRRADPSLVLHLAAQVAVTTSVTDPRLDFEINALGTFNLLEGVRAHAPEAALVYSSTNKVYGGLEDLAVEEGEETYRLPDLPDGIPETRPLDFHSPYGCSKGAADQYVLDYARIYGLKTVSFRQSCIYGPGQFGIEDQGWVAWFAIAAVTGRRLTIYGDGKQVRDVLYVDDLVEAFRAAEIAIDRARGRAYNIGGGPAHTLSLRRLLSILGERLGRPIEAAAGDPRPGDQRVFICDIRRAADELDWRPAVDPEEGVGRLLDWVTANRNGIEATLIGK